MSSKFFALAAVLALLGCSSSTVEPPEFVEDSSSSVTSSGSVIPSSSGNNPSSSGTGSSGADNSSSSFDALPEIEDGAPAGPSDLRVSPIISTSPPTIVLNWSDVPYWLRDEYDGYKIFRNDDYDGWNEIGEAPPEQQFFKDATLDSTIYRFIYRIVAYKTTGGSDSLITKFSNEAGTVPLTALGFGNVVFDQPNEIAITRWGPSTYELTWTHSGLKPEAGFVVQRLNPYPDTVGTPHLRDSADAIVSVGVWTDLDTLLEADNHFWIHDSLARVPHTAPSQYRVYAFYTDAFDRLISEYTSTVQTPDAYNPLIQFEPPTLFSALLSPSDIDVTWVGAHNRYVELANENTNTLDSAWYQIRVNDGSATYADSADLISMGRVYQISAGNTCSFSISVRIAWRDRFNVIDYTDWAIPSGTKPGTQGTLIDKGSLCKE